MSGFPFGEACLVGTRGSGISWDLHHRGGSPQSSWMRMLSGRWGFWIFLDSLVLLMDAFWWGPWPVASVCGPSWYSVGGLFDCIQEKKKKFRVSMPLWGGMNDGFDCCVGILIFLLSDPRFFFLARLFSNFRLAVVL